MFVKKIQLINFKKFNKLTLDLSRQRPPPKLVLLIGVNGSGKSCIFDAFEAISSKAKDDTMLAPTYYRKNPAQDFQISIEFSDKTTITQHDHKKAPDNLSSTAFYGRSSLRQLPQLTRMSLWQAGRVHFETDSDRPRMYIEKDNRFENDLDKTMESVLKDVFKANNSPVQIQKQYIIPLNEAFTRIFGEDNQTKLTLLELIPPLDGKVASILFKKGKSTIHYNYLGNGEKQVFNILVNLLSRTSFYQNTIYYLDELDLHLNTKLQAALLKEIVEHWIPIDCQLWTASHSLGFIEYANEIEQAVILDFDDLNFDQPQTLFPQTKNRYDVFEIAVSKEFLAKVIEGKRIIFAENTDTPFYNNLGIKDTIFFTAIDKNDVFFKAQNLHYEGLIDRDFLTNEEIELIGKIYPNLLILKYYSIENYFYHPDNLAEYYQSQAKPFDKSVYIERLTESKNTNLGKIVLGIVGARNSYPFFKEHEQVKFRKQFKNNAENLLALLQNNDFEIFYQIFPAKDYGRELAERQHLNKDKLAQTLWFKNQIQTLFSWYRTKNGK
jgi:energy-coupling factor transporter ATP-binding protein EcfA2